MIIVLERGIDEGRARAILSDLEELGLSGAVLEAEDRRVIHVTAGPARLARKLLGRSGIEALVPTSGPRVRRFGRRLFPYYALWYSAFLVLAVGVLVFLAGALPPGLGDPVDLRHAPPPAEFPWYVRAPLAIVALFPSGWRWVGQGLVLALMAVILLLPWLDRTPPPAIAERKGRLALGILVLLAWCWLSVQGVTA